MSSGSPETMANQQPVPCLSRRLKPHQQLLTRLAVVPGSTPNSTYITHRSSPASTSNSTPPTGGTYLPAHTPEPITTEFLRTERNEIEPYAGTVIYNVRYPYCRPLFSRYVAAIYRDHTGKHCRWWTRRMSSSAIPCHPDTTGERVFFGHGMPLDTDESRTEIYPYCDLAARHNPLPTLPSHRTELRPGRAQHHGFLTGSDR